jgi:broad specificity phosphatase PhoE
MNNRIHLIRHGVTEGVSKGLLYGKELSRNNLTLWLAFFRRAAPFLERGTAAGRIGF